MKYAFTKEPVDGYLHQNPRYWEYSAPPADATEVVVDADFPAIIAHFEAAGVPVNAGGSADFTVADIAKMKLSEVKELAEVHGVNVSGMKVAEARDVLSRAIFVNL